MIVNVARSVVPRKKSDPRPKMTSPSDYMPTWYQDEDLRDIPQKKQTVQEMKDILLGWVNRGNKKKSKIKKPIINKRTGKKRYV